MSLKVTQVIPYISEGYPYTHRVSLVHEDLRKAELILGWLDENRIPCCCIGTAFYISKPYLTMFLLKWS